jgi:hypothetical protein
MVLICPTRQAKVRAADWHDGQFVHGGCAGGGYRARECASTARGNEPKQLAPEKTLPTGSRQGLSLRDAGLRSYAVAMLQPCQRRRDQV